MTLPMPELPEVEIMRRYFEAAALHKKIVALHFYDHLDKIFKTPRAALRSAIEGREFTASRRIGKYLFAQLGPNGPWLHLHFGMTGNLQLFTGDDLPKFTRMAFHFAEGDKLAFCDMRKFGVVELTDSPEAYQTEKSIGEDFGTITFPDFLAPLRSKRVVIKTALLSQTHFAGIGNWIADEMLFEASLHPLSLCTSLSEQQFKALYDSGQKIVREAIEADTHYGNFPPHFFVNFRKSGALHPQHPRSPVERLVVGGRGTFIVPEKQVLR